MNSTIYEALIAELFAVSVLSKPGTPTCQGHSGICMERVQSLIIKFKQGRIGDTCEDTI